LIGYVIAEIFFAVYEMAISTILLSFCEDCVVHGGSPAFAPRLLMEAVGEEYVEREPSHAAARGNKVVPIKD
jgi:hypothetical protein